MMFVVTKILALWCLALFGGEVLALSTPPMSHDLAARTLRLLPGEPIPESLKMKEGELFTYEDFGNALRAMLIDQRKINNPELRKGYAFVEYKEGKIFQKVCNGGSR